jgi:hypothetical protein
VPIYAVNATLTVEEDTGSSPIDPVMGAAVVGAAAALVVGVVVARRL